MLLQADVLSESTLAFMLFSSWMCLFRSTTLCCAKENEIEKTAERKNNCFINTCFMPVKVPKAVPSQLFPTHLDKPLTK